MKKRLLFCSITMLAVIALIMGVISSATERHPTQTGFSTTPIEHSAAQVTSTETETAPAVKKKACECCSERIARLQEQIRKARERRQATQQAAAAEASQQQPSRASEAP